LDFRFWIGEAIFARTQCSATIDYDLMAFATPAESPLQYRRDKRKVSHGHEGVAVIEGTDAPTWACDQFTRDAVRGI
jgi:hypothetical protein